MTSRWSWEAPLVGAVRPPAALPRRRRFDEPHQGTRGHVLDAAGRSATSNALPVAHDETPIYFGEFHWHTDFSGDGERTLQAALTSARDELGLDFAGPADHLAPDGTYSIVFLWNRPNLQTL